MAPLSLRIEIGRYGSSDEQRRGNETKYRVLINQGGRLSWETVTPNQATNYKGPLSMGKALLIRIMGSLTANVVCRATEILYKNRICFKFLVKQKKADRNVYSWSPTKKSGQNHHIT